MTPELIDLAEKFLPHTAPFPESVRSVVADTVLSAGPDSRAAVEKAFRDVTNWWDDEIYPWMQLNQRYTSLYLSTRYFLHAVLHTCWNVRGPAIDSVKTARVHYDLYLKRLNRSTTSAP